MYQSQIQTGRKQSPETVRKHFERMRAIHADPDKKAALMAASADGQRRWHADEDNARVFAERSSERMKRRHADPEFQKRRNARSSRTMKANWESHRDTFIAAACARYAKGVGIASKESKRRKKEAATWIMKRAQAALHAETDYDATFAEVQHRLRLETPYDEMVHGDHIEYCRLMGGRVVNSPECRDIADAFLSTAIPRISGEWRDLQAQMKAS